MLKVSRFQTWVLLFLFSIKSILKVEANHKKLFAHAHLILLVLEGSRRPKWAVMCGHVLKAHGLYMGHLYMHAPAEQKRDIQSIPCVCK